MPSSLHHLAAQRNRWLIPIGLVVALLVMIFTALVTYRNMKRATDSAKWLARSREVLAVCEGILADLSKAESAGRGFLLSNDSLYREQFDDAIAAALQKQATLQHLTLDNAEQRERVSRLATLIGPKLALMERFVSYRDVPEPDSFEEARLLFADTEQMTAIRRLVADIQMTEDALLAERTVRLNDRLWETRFSLVGSTAISFGLVAGTVFLLRRHWHLEHTSATQSRRHRLEKDELARYNQRLLESTGEGIYGIDNNGHCTFINRAGAIILGGDPADFLNQNMHERIHHSTADGKPFPLEDCPIYKASQTGDGCRVDDEVFWRLDGKPVAVEYSSFPIKDEQRVEGAVVTFNDISARLRAHHELQVAKDAAEAANESKSQFLANMSHELRTPLNAVIMYSELLAEEAEDHNVPGLIPDLQRIRSAGKHLLELVNSVLDLSKVDAGRMELFPEEFHVGDLVQEVASTVAPLMETNHNELTVIVAPGIETMFSDVTKLRQILYNLLSNASKFTKNGKITVAVTRDEQNPSLVFSVTDTGIGMSEEQLAKLFQPFTQADASTTRKYGGTGLGLAITKRFTELLGGEVEAQSVADVGTTFKITVPQRMPAAASSETVPTDQPLSITQSGQAESTGPNAANVVLVIDDDPAIRDILTRVLISEGIRPVTAADGAEGLMRARATQPDLIILDVMMPKLDGWSVLTALKADEELRDIPVVMHSIKDDQDLGFMLGASEYLVKPVDRSRLVTMLRRLMNDGDTPILIVDDDEAARRALSRTLQSEGWKVEQAGDGVQGLAAVQDCQPAVILLDLMMPTMDGFEFLETLHQTPQGRSIPIIVLTAKDLTAEDHERLNGAVERVLAKGTLSRHGFFDEVRRLVATVARRTQREPTADKSNSPEKQSHA